MARVVSVGLVNRTVVHLRKVFIQAIRDHVCAIIVARNHSSGRLDLSPDDREITDRLSKGATLWKSACSIIS
jgi:DNA repair protein RadC